VYEYPIYVIQRSLSYDRSTAFLQTQFSTESDQALPLSVYSILWFRQGHPVAGYFFFLLFPSRISFRLSFLQYRVLDLVSTQDVTNSISIPVFLLHVI